MDWVVRYKNNEKIQKSFIVLGGYKPLRIVGYYG